MIKKIASFATYILSVVLVIVLVAVIVIESQSGAHLKPLTKERPFKAVSCDDLGVCQFQDRTGTEIFLPNGSSQ